MIPKQIFYYWDYNPPEIINICIESWKRTYPEFQIIYYDKESALAEFYILNSFLTINVEAFSDILRLLLLCKYGGIWLDASIYIKSRDNPLLNDIENLDITRIHGFGGLDTHVISNWFIISTNNNDLGQWLKQTIINYSNIDYINSVYDINYPFKDYLRQDVAFIQCFGKKYIFTHSGVKCLHIGSFTITEMVKTYSIDDHNNITFHYGMFKLTGLARSIIENAIKNQTYKENSITSLLTNNRTVNAHTSDIYISNSKCIAECIIKYYIKRKLTIRDIMFVLYYTHFSV